jgi:hypothetical protein
MKTWGYSDTENSERTILMYAAAFITIAIVLMLQGIISYTFAQSITGKSIIGVFPLESKPYGLTYGDWTGKWWQWDVSIPKDQNPGGDSTGKYCGQKQVGPVWFLTGTFGGSATRTCDIPAGKAILLSLINSQCNYLTKPNLKTNSQLLACAKSLNEGITKLDATIDGVKIPELQKYRVQSQPFTIVYGPNNVDGAPIGTTKAVSDGYWVLLKPLPAGNHTIHFAGAVVNYVQGTLNNFANEVTYNVNVK